MAQGFNKQTILGNLAADAELRYTEKSGKPVAHFRVIANTGSGEYEHAEGFNVVLWGQLAEALVPHLVKGKQVFVEGETRSHKYQDKDGVTRYASEVVITSFFGSIVLLGGGARKAESNSAQDYSEHEEEDEIPY